MSQRIPLTQGAVAFVDDADYDRLRQWKWQLSNHGYATRVQVQDGKRITIPMHRFLMDAQPGQVVDNINGDCLDDRRANLRLVNRSQNQWNRKLQRSASGCKGVTPHNGHWHVRIRVHGRCIHLGYHNDLEAAALLYDHAAWRFFGEYARLNRPTMPPMGFYNKLLDQILAGTWVRAKTPPPERPPIPKARSRYRGVYWDRGRWRAAIKIKGCKRHLGYFDDEAEAARAYDRAAVEAYGPRAKRNFGP